MRHYKILSNVVLSFLIVSIACSKSDDDSSTSVITNNQSQSEDINNNLFENFTEINKIINKLKYLENEKLHIIFKKRLYEG